MRLRVRLPVALAIVALFVAVPAPGPSGKREMAAILVHDWLCSDDSPLGLWRQDGIVPPLVVDLRTSPPIVDDAARAAEAAKYGSAASDWATARSAAGEPTRVDPLRGGLPLRVHVGDHGVQVQMPSPTGAPVQFGRMFPSRVSLLPALAVVVVALLLRRLLPALLAAVLAGVVACVATAASGTGVWFDAANGAIARFATDALWLPLGEPMHLWLLPGAVLFALAMSWLPRRVPALSSPRARAALARLTDATIVSAAGLLVPHTPAASLAWHCALTSVLVLATMLVRRDGEPGARFVVRTTLAAITLLVLTSSVLRGSDALGAGAFLAAAG